MRLPVYRTVFDTVLTRTDAEDAHHRAFGTWRRLAMSSDVGRLGRVSDRPSASRARRMWGS